MGQRTFDILTMLHLRHQWLKIKRLNFFQDIVSLVFLDTLIYEYIFDYEYLIDFWFQANESSQWSSYWKTMAKSRNVITHDQPRVCRRCIPLMLDFFLLFIVFLSFSFSYYCICISFSTLFINVFNINKNQRNQLFGFFLLLSVKSIIHLDDPMLIFEIRSTLFIRNTTVIIIVWTTICLTVRILKVTMKLLHLHPG